MDRMKHSHHEDYEDPVEIALVGDLTDNEADLTDRLLSVPPGGECVLFIDSPGGSPYCAIALTTLIRLRRLRATGIVTGECSSATLWPFAACHRRIVTPYSVMLFHPMKWQSEEHVGLQEAAEWARHFGSLEKDMDQLLAELLNIDRQLLDEWINPGRYVSGREFADAGLAELVSLGSGFESVLEGEGCEPPSNNGDNGSHARSTTSQQTGGTSEAAISSAEAIRAAT